MRHPRRATAGRTDSVFKKGDGGQTSEVGAVLSSSDDCAAPCASTIRGERGIADIEEVDDEGLICLECSIAVDSDADRL